MLVLRLKQCEAALRSGRLDEAYGLIRQSDLRTHCRGQQLLDQLVPALLDRGRKHLAAGRLAEAETDADKAAQLAGNTEPVVQLQTAVERALGQEQEANRQCGQALALARREIDRGQLSVVQRMLETAPPPADARVDGLKRELHARRLEMQACQSKASAAFDQGDWEAVIDHLSPLPRTCSQNGELRNLCGQISQIVCRRIRDSIQTGRLDIAAALLAKLRRLPAETTDMIEASSLLDQCRQAHDAVAAGQWPEAQEMLTRLQGLLPGSDWIMRATQQIQQIGQGLTQLRSGPLSLMATGAGPAVQTMQQIGDDFHLHVDAAGGFRVVARPAITLGPVSSSRRVDVPLAIESNAPTITIIRSDEDYFLRASAAITVNGNSTTSRLLNSADKIVIGSRCRITFRRPSAASATAVLDLSDAHPAAASLRHVVLMDREIVIGPGATDHVPAPDLSQPAILQRRGGGLAVRVGGQSFDVIPNTPINIGTLHLVVTTERRP